MQKTPPTPTAWSIAGSDSGGGAGLQADLKTFSAFGVHGCCITTALTAQNTTAVTHIAAVAPATIEAQITALKTDLPPQAIKTGMLGSVETCPILIQHFSHAPFPIICDPVLKSTSGTPLLAEGARDLFIQKWLPLVTLLTPNLPETEQLLNHSVDSIEAAAQELLTLGPKSILIKGGHAEGDCCSDYWTDGTQAYWLTSPRIKTNNSHGTGCVLASAIAAGLATGRPLQQAIIHAKTFLNQSLRSPTHLGAGNGPMQLTPFQNNPADRPTFKPVPIH